MTEDPAARARAINDEAARRFQAGELAAAREGFERALALTPAYVEAWQNLAVVRLALADPDGAIAAMKSALEAAPGDAGLWHGLGRLLKRLGREGDAAEAYARAARLRPDDPEIAEDRGRAALALERPEEALDAVARLGERPGALSVRARAAVALGDAAAARDTWRRLFALKPCHTGAVGGLLMALLYDGEDPGEIPRVARAWAAACAGAPARAWPNDRDAARRLRVGYVSPDFWRHAVGWFALPPIEAHDPAAVETFLYSTGLRDDDMTTRFRAACGGRWRSLRGLDAESAARRVREDSIDVLVDLSGHTEDARLDLFMLKPAPVQLTWLGFPATTGLAAFDARLTDAIADPPGAEIEAVEPLFRLAGGFHCWRPPADVADLKPAGLPEGPPVFGSFNNARKISAATVALWARVLAALPGSRLWLRSGALSVPSFAARLAAAFAATGVEPGRVVLDGNWRGQRDHFAAYGAMHVALDPVPYNGTTTTVEALWMGVPVVALAGGDRHAARVGASLLTHAGAGEFLARDADDYVAKAIALAADRARLAGQRGELRRRLLASPIGDAPAFARKLEAAYRRLWAAWCARGAG